MSDEWSPRPKRRGTHITRLPNANETGYVYAPYIPIFKFQRIPVKPRTLKSNWTVEFSQDLAEEFGMNKTPPKVKPGKPAYGKHRNKHNGIEYIVVANNVKYIDGVKYWKVVRDPFDYEGTWVRADVLEPVTSK